MNPFGSVREVEVQIDKYIRDAAALASGAPLHELNCALDGIRSGAALSAAIRDLGAIYIAKMKALRNAAPLVRGNTISVFTPRPAVAPNFPSVEDEEYLSACRNQLLERGFVLAADADTYEEIAKKYPGAIHPARVRGSEARRWLALRAPDAVAKRIKLY